MIDIKQLLPSAVYQAAVNANSPTALNPFATIADIPAGGGGLSSVLAAGDTGSAGQDINLTGDGVITLKASGPPSGFLTISRNSADGRSIINAGVAGGSVLELRVGTPNGLILNSPRFPGSGYSYRVGNNTLDATFVVPITVNRTYTFQDNSGVIPLGPAWNTLIANPTATEDGYVIKWNDTANEYQLVADAVGTTPSLSAVLAAGNTTGGASISLSNGDHITAASGGGQLTLRDGADNVIALTNDNGAYIKAWFYGDDSVAQFGFGSSYFGVGGGSTPSIGSFLGGARSVVTYDNSGGSTPIPAFEGTKYPTIISSQLSDVNVNINNTVVLGGNNINGKTSNTAYVNQIGFNKSSVFETILVHTTPTADRTITFQDASGTVAFNSVENWTNATNVITTRGGYDANATTVDEIADNLGTLISDLKAVGILS